MLDRSTPLTCSRGSQQSEAAQLLDVVRDGREAEAAADRAGELTGTCLALICERREELAAQWVR